MHAFRVAGVQPSISDHKLLVDNLAEDWFCDCVCLRALVVVLDARVVHIRIGEFAVFGHLADLVKGLLTSELVRVLLHDFLVNALIVVLRLLQVEQRSVSCLEHLLLPNVAMVFELLYVSVR